MPQIPRDEAGRLSPAYRRAFEISETSGIEERIRRAVYDGIVSGDGIDDPSVRALLGEFGVGSPGTGSTGASDEAERRVILIGESEDDLSRLETALREGDQ